MNVVIIIFPNRQHTSDYCIHNPSNKFNLRHLTFDFEPNKQDGATAAMFFLWQEAHLGSL